MELEDKDIKRTTINIFHIFKTIEKSFNTEEQNGRYKKDSNGTSGSEI